MSDKGRKTLVGWQGVTLESPADWSLSAVGGDEKSGYFRVDSTGTLAVEVKWSKVSGQVDLGSRLEAYLKDLRKKSRRRRVDFEHRIRKSRDRAALGFSWRADRRGQGRLWRCDQCSRVLIAQVSGAPEDDVAGVASYMLPSIEDHLDDGWRTWAVYELIADVPPEYELEKKQLMSGYIRLAFRKRNNRLTIERWGLANVALKRCPLAEWYADRLRHDLRAYRYAIEATDFWHDQAVSVSGRRAGLRQTLKSAGEFLIGRRPAVYVNCCAWVCEESNKIYSVQSVHSRSEAILDEVVERVDCH